MSDGGLVKLSERSCKSYSLITLGRFGVLWLSNMVNKLLVANAKRSFVLKFNEASRAFLAQRYRNKAGRYVAIIKYDEGIREGR